MAAANSGTVRSSSQFYLAWKHPGAFVDSCAYPKKLKKQPAEAGTCTTQLLALSSVKK